MICPNCGANLPDNTPFCTSCGCQTGAQSYEQPDYNQQYAQQPAYNQQQVYNQPYGQMPADPGKGLGIGALVCGILSIILSYFVVGIVLGIVAIAIGSNAQKKSRSVGLENKMAKAGIVCGIIGLALLGLLIVVGLIIGVGSLAFAF